MGTASLEERLTNLEERVEQIELRLGITVKIQRDSIAPLRPAERIVTPGPAAGNFGDVWEGEPEVTGTSAA